MFGEKNSGQYEKNSHGNDNYEAWLRLGDEVPSPIAEEPQESAETSASEGENLEVQKVPESFRERVEINKGLYDNLAKQCAVVLALYPTIEATASGTTVQGGWVYGIDMHEQSSTSGVTGGLRMPKYFTPEQQKAYRREYEMAFSYLDAKRMMAMLDDGVTKEGEGDKVIYEGLVLQDDQTEWFQKNWNGFSFDMKHGTPGHLDQILSAEQMATVEKKAEELMDGSKYEKVLDQILRKSSPNYIGWDEAAEAEAVISQLRMDSNGLFGFEDKGDYEWSAETKFVPDMETRYRLEEKILKLKERIAKTKMREYEKMAASPRGKRVLGRQK